ncbi:MAG TPA: EamA family transporter, partial [Afipia sp.]|nr:EamA family transporter [Afipia sp.]
MTQSVIAMQPSNAKAAGWMAGWLTLMLVLLVAGREATRELDVFQIMEMRSVIGLLMLYPLIHANGGFARMKTLRPLTHIVRNIVHYAPPYGWGVGAEA